MKDPSKWVGKKVGVWTGKNGGPRYSPKKHKKERAARGFSDYDWWGFDSYLTFVILGGLKKFRKDANGYPGDLTSEEWNDILDKMILGFETRQKMVNCKFGYEGERYEAAVLIRDEGTALFVKWYDQLWD